MAGGTDSPTPEAPGWRNPRLTFRRLSGLDRSGPPPPQTLAGAPLNVWTIPNAIGFVRLALIPVFVILAFRAEDTSTSAAIVFAVIAWSDYLDGIAARVTGQYSRFGALLDPVVDRLLIISGVVVVYANDLLPRWALIALIAREVLMLIGGRYAQTHGIELKINWLGRWAVWPVMSAIFFALVDVRWLALTCLYLGLVLAYAATVQYARTAAASTRA